MKKIDIIVPIFNEEASILELIENIRNISNELKKDKQIEFKILFVNNGSTDNSKKILGSLHYEDIETKTIHLIRNFGIDGALKAGIDETNADAAILIHGDLQDNTSDIKQLIDLWEQGNEQVVVRYKPKKRENLIRKLGTYVYYKWANFASSNLIIPGVSDFRIISRNVINFIKSVNETSYLLRGILIWPGFKFEIIDSVKGVRKYGKSHLNLSTMVSYFKLPLSLSTRVLYIIPAISLVLFFVSLIFILFTLFYFVLTGDLLIQIEPRLSLLIILNVFTLLILGILSSFLGVIIDEVKKRPLYIKEVDSNSD